MLVRWFFLVALTLGVGSVLAQEDPPQDPIGIDRFEGELVVEWRTKSIEFNPRRIIFGAGVKASYGVTTVFSDQLTVFLEEDENYAVATGNVRLEDPEGTVEAAELTFNWVEGTGHASSVRIAALGMLVRAARIDITPERWELDGVLLAGCEIPGLPPPSIAARSVTVRLGEEIVLRQPSIRFGGSTLLTLPRYSISLDPRARGVLFPTLAYRQGAGVGVSWSPEILLDDRTLASLSATIYQHDRPSLSLEAARSLLPPPRMVRGGVEHPPLSPMRPRSELEQRFNFAYFESVAVRTPEQEERYLASPKRTLSVGTFWNQTPQDRNVDRLYNKPFQVGYEHGGRFGDFIGASWMRFHQIEEIGGPNRLRGTVEASVLAPSFSLGRGVRTFSRVDGALFQEANSSYGWLRGQAGLIYEPSSELRLSGALSSSTETGSPTFLLDRLPARHAMHLRADFVLGPRTISLLTAYDLEKGRWYDHEVFLAQVVGCFEPYVIWRNGPRETQIGVRLRLDELLSRLQRRDFRRNVPTPDRQQH